MNAYIVRLAEQENRPHEIVGIFAADSLEELFHFVDECCDVSGCEAMKINAGGIFWPGSVDYNVPTELSEDTPGLPGGAIFTDSWMDSIHSGGDWELIDPEVIETANDA